MYIYIYTYIFIIYIQGKSGHNLLPFQKLSRRRLPAWLTFYQWRGSRGCSGWREGFASVLGSDRVWSDPLET